jgi:hypothetical protein
MKILDAIGHIIAWVGSLILCGAVFGVSLFAIAAMLSSSSPEATSNDHYVEALASPPVLEADAFDVRKVAAFLAEPRTGTPPPVAPSATLEQVRVSSTVAASTTDPLPSQPIAPTETPSKVASIAVNLRAGPSRNTISLGVLQPWQPIEVVQWHGGWAHVVTASGETGWVYGKYLDDGADAQVLTALDVVEQSVGGF